VIPCIIILLLLSLASAETPDIKLDTLLIDDFEDGDSRNLLPGEYPWFEFADIVDGGTSRIIDFAADEQETSGNGCIRFDFELGDRIYDSLLSDEWNENIYLASYLGFGTDLSNDKFDLSCDSAKISFRARSNDTLLMFMELVIGTIFDYTYPRFYCIVDTSWKTFTIDLNDTLWFRRPDFDHDYDRDAGWQKAYSLAYAQKLNWQVADYYWPMYWDDISAADFVNYYNYTKGERRLYIDDVKIIGKFAVAVRKSPVIQAAKQLHRNAALSIAPPTPAFDLLGRDIKNCMTVSGIGIRRESTSPVTSVYLLNAGSHHQHLISQGGQR